jgi:hypothetical protein
MLPSVFLGASLAFLGASLGCLVVVLNSDGGPAQFWAIVGTVVLFSLAIGTGVSAILGYRDVV